MFLRISRGSRERQSFLVGFYGGFWWRECCPVLGRLGAGAGMRFVWARAVRAVLLRAFLGALGLMLQAVTTYFCGQGRISAKKLCCVTAFLA